MDLKRVAEVAAGECVRQQVGVYELGGLISAYAAAQGLAESGRRPDDWALLGRQGLAFKVEGDNGGHYRTVPASFADGSFAIHPDNVPRAMGNWYAAVGKVDVDDYVKEFLDIHPFSDGNGRLAWLIRTWLLGQWANPEPLPDYYGPTPPPSPEREEKETQ
jgi:hypothetical protein